MSNEKAEKITDWLVSRLGINEASKYNVSELVVFQAYADEVAEELIAISETLMINKNQECNELKERVRKLEFMIDNGLGWKDMENDNKPV